MRHAMRGFCLVVAAGGAAVGPALDALASERERLVLSLEVSKASFILFEPVTVRFRVHNPTEETIQAVAVAQDGSNLAFSITGPSGPVGYRPRLAALRPTMEKLYEPGSSDGGGVGLHWNASTSGWTFPVSGKYTISARMWVGNDPERIHIESKPIEITVAEPLGVDADAISAFRTKDQFLQLMRDGSAAYCRGKPGPACFEELDRFVREHRRSAYAPGLVWDLADSVATGLLEVTPRDDLAIGLYRSFLKQWPANPSAPRVMYRLAMVLDQSGRHKEAEEVIQQFQRTFPDQKILADHLRNNLVGDKRSTASQ